MNVVLNNHRENLFDVIKGIAIALVVVGHATCPLVRFIALFHVAIFFIVAGYFYKDTYIASWGNVFSVVKRRLYSLYIPFLVFSFFFISMHNCFWKWGFFSINVGFYSMEFYSFGEYMTQLVKMVLHFQNNEQLLSAFWFIRSLFVATIAFLGMDYIFHRLFPQKIASILRWLIPTLLLIADFIISHSSLKTAYFAFPSVVFQLPMAMFLFMLGGYLQKFYYSYLQKLPTFVVMLISLAVLLGCFFSTEQMIQFSANQYINPLYFFLASVSGWYLVYTLALLFQKRIWISAFFALLGRSSLFILALHFLAFKLVTLGQIGWYGDSLNMLGRFPCFRTGNGYWIVYSLVGILLPVVVRMVYLAMKKRVFSLVRTHK